MRSPLPVRAVPALRVPTLASSGLLEAREDHRVDRFRVESGPGHLMRREGIS